MSPECNFKGKITEPPEAVLCEGDVKLDAVLAMWLCHKHLLLAQRYTSGMQSSNDSGEASDKSDTE